MVSGLWMLLPLLYGFSLAEKAPYYSFVHEAVLAPEVSFYDYIIVGGGTAGCPLAATRSVINAGFYSHAQPEFLRQAGLNEALVNYSYQWVEKKVAFRPPMMQWQSALRGGLLEAGVLPSNGFTFDHIYGTKVGSTLFDGDNHRHSAADLLEYANPFRLKVYLHATVQRILFETRVFARTRAQGVVFEDKTGKKHWALLTRDYKSEVILSAGSLGSPQLLMLSGIGPSQQLQKFGIKVVLDQPMVGQGLVDNPLNVLLVPSPNPVELSLVSFVGITRFGSYIEACSGISFTPAWSHSVAKALATILNQTEESSTKLSQDGMPKPDSLLNTRLRGGIIFEKVKDPISTGYLELRNTNPRDNPKVTFNYYQSPEDMMKCVKGMRTVIDAVFSKSFSNFRYEILSAQALLDLIVALPLNQRPRHLNTAFSLEKFCMDTVMTIWHYHGGCRLGKVVDHDYKVFGVDGLRIIDGSTFTSSPGTNPQATIMMLGRYMGLRILHERYFGKK